MTESPFVVISILNWNAWRDTPECLESVRRLDYPNYLTVVVDNGSRDGSAERIKGWAHENLGAGHFLAEYTQEIALQGGDPQTEEALESVPSPAKLVLIRNEENLGFSGGIREYVDHEVTALPSPPRDPESLARNIARLLDDGGLRRRRAVAGHQRIQQFTWERSTDQLEQFIQKQVSLGAGK